MDKINPPECVTSPYYAIEAIQKGARTVDMRFDMGVALRRVYRGIKE